MPLPFSQNQFLSASRFQPRSSSHVRSLEDQLLLAHKLGQTLSEVRSDFTGLDASGEAPAGRTE